MYEVVFQINPIEKSDNKFNITIKIPMNYGWIDYVYFVSNNISYELKHNMNDDNCAIFSSEITLETKALYKYYFTFNSNNQIRYVLKDKITTDSPRDIDMFKMSVNFEVPDWAKGQMMYHIFIDRFNRGSKEKMKSMERRHVHNSWNEEVCLGPDEEGIWNNDFYGGDLKGIIQKLDYIKSLGVSILYLSPVVYSQSTHRYDASDFEQIDPYAGNSEDLTLLCNEAHKRGMKVILDAVFNHTGSDSKYFNQYNNFETLGAYQSLDSPYLPFYKYTIRDNKPIFEYWWGMENLPVCNGNSKEWQDYITGQGGIIDIWFSLGIDGLRLDVADELTDDFIKLIRKAVKRNKEDGFILGEVWKNPMRMNRGYIESGKAMDSVMNYNFIDSLIRYFRYKNKDELLDKINEFLTEYPTDTIYSLMNFTSTHDITRAINLWDEEIFSKNSEWSWNLNNENIDFIKKYQLKDYQTAKEIYKAYVFFLTFMPGNLSIFYGDEIGMQGLGNLNNRKPFTWDNIDQDLLNFFKYIGYIRNNEPFMRKADLKVYDGEFITFERYNDDEKIFVAVNPYDREVMYEIPPEYKENTKVYTLKKPLYNKLKPYGGIAIKKDYKF